MSLSKYRKSITAVVTGLLGWGIIVVASPATTISASEWLMLGIAGATALGVYSVPNEGV